MSRTNADHPSEQKGMCIWKEDIFKIDNISTNVLYNEWTKENCKTRVISEMKVNFPENWIGIARMFESHAWWLIKVLDSYHMLQGRLTAWNICLIFWTVYFRGYESLEWFLDYFFKIWGHIMIKQIKTWKPTSWVLAHLLKTW